ncbi:peptide/nickel transport system ATP-binding protein [Herbaspirillum sp. Sphag1AN]|uniref:ABC transporter ATP-binding protein n=1 Tax=unclassified Herbaspirillum TaxID=2624150 RepID=UPI001612BF61|nr:MULTISPECIES: ABC transporter ATP-binding protein [unclassified Herbaspirillum]MBB3211884.1 peptide/nickel transport system ATP-binding protein [Herbaspirillum sp. Sphag1AN]MBB3244282.1 peptide/nickel transport system ATP-binding protein [Herbaspirillum sp. Sphag64]
MTSLLDIRNLHVAFPGHDAVTDLNLSMAAGETLALVGESGCGKSTTALSLLRLLPPSARVRGQILFEGRDLTQLSEDQFCDLRGNAISMIFQEPMTSLNPVLTIGQQVVEAIRLHQPLSAQAAKARAIELLELVRIPEPQRRFHDYPHHLSGGQRQRVMIAMAVSCQPRLLIADEPTTALDVTIQAQILALLDQLRRDLGMSVLLITHDLAVVEQWADRVAVMLAGKKVEDANSSKLFAQPKHAYTRGLLGASLHLEQDYHYRAGRLPEICTTLDQDNVPGFTLTTRAHAQPLVGSSERSAPAVTAVAVPLLSVQDVHTKYASRNGVVHAVQGVSFDIAAGETVGLVGESGCGKSTLSKTIIRLVDPSAGKILLAGEDIASLDQKYLRPHRRRVQMIFQDPYASLNPRHTVSQILDAALVIHEVKNKAERRRRITEIIDLVGLPQRALHSYAHQFSGGQRQRIGIARALILKPALVICDEPVSALDVSVQAQILNLLVDLKHEFGLSYLFISHDLSVVRYIADKVLVMHGGRIVETGAHNSIWQAPQHAYTRTLIAAVPSAAASRAPQAQPQRRID